MKELGAFKEAMAAATMEGQQQPSSMTTNAATLTTDGRSEILDQAVMFLCDPKVHAASLQKKISFLEGKGLTSAEISRALSQADLFMATTNVAPKGMLTPHPPLVSHLSAPRPSSTWTDWCLGLVMASGVGYVVYHALQKYFPNILASGDTPSLDDTINNMQEKIVKMQYDYEEWHAARLKHQEELQMLKEEIQKMHREWLPKIEDQMKQIQDTNAQEWRTELASLKTLLLQANRPMMTMTTGSSAAMTSSNSIPSWQLSSSVPPLVE